MKVLVVGGGGREHALCWKIAQSPLVDEVFCAPGNAGTAAIARNAPVDVMDFDGLVALARDGAIDLTIVGPEAPLCAGIVDRFQQEGLRIFGPTAAAARIEGDKAYAKRLMRTVDVPTAESRVFTSFEDARAYVLSREDALVVKAAGLAGGKGVTVCEDQAQAIAALREIMVDRVFGEAGDRVVVEERIKGQELSIFALVEGHTIYVLESAQDHKAIGDGGTGPNTGGMGACSPAQLATPELFRIVERDILMPTIDLMRREGAPYNGLLYVGLMVTPGGPKVLEFNCRFGDPECQAILPRIKSGFLETISAAVDGQLEEARLEWDERPAVSVVMASDGYPGPHQTGKVITGLDTAGEMPDVKVFHSGTSRLEHLTITSGGRVLCVTALGDCLADAQRRAYEGVDAIEFENAYYRKDIAGKAIQQSAR